MKYEHLSQHSVIFQKCTEISVREFGQLIQEVLAALGENGAVCNQVRIKGSHHRLTRTVRLCRCAGRFGCAPAHPGGRRNAGIVRDI